jgi:signal transduction histidine kinase
MTTDLANEPCDDERPARLGRELLSSLWQQPLYAIPFALFFGTLYGARPSSYWAAYQISLVFAFVIRGTMIVYRLLVLPRLRAGRGRVSGAVEGAGYIVSSIVGSFAAALLIDRFMLPGFLGSPLAVARAFAYTLLFSTTIGGIAYAIAFYRQSLARARAIERLGAQLAQAELRALRAQVHPHFLFNALNTIAALVRENPAEAEETITRLAEVFRYALRASDHEHVRLGDELEFLRAYLDIERTRFGDRLRVVEQVEPGLESLAVPSLLLQPLVENAVRYAASARPEGATITIRGTRGDGVAVLEIADDGPGIDDGRAPSGTGFGLHSVRERMRAAGPPHAVAVETAAGRGTRVRVTLPLRHHEPRGGHS